jgi:hypothetical protein
VQQKGVSKIGDFLKIKKLWQEKKYKIKIF